MCVTAITGCVRHNRAAAVIRDSNRHRIAHINYRTNNAVIACLCHRLYNIVAAENGSTFGIVNISRAVSRAKAFIRA